MEYFQKCWYSRLEACIEVNKTLLHSSHTNSLNLQSKVFFFPGWTLKNTVFFTQNKQTLLPKKVGKVWVTDDRHILNVADRPIMQCSQRRQNIIWQKPIGTLSLSHYISLGWDLTDWLKQVQLCYNVARSPLSSLLVLDLFLINIITSQTKQ